nr:AIF_HP1_G0031050.mRNA.1.CDS.1 [Saccharomyces cerevisiae]
MAMLRSGLDSVQSPDINKESQGFERESNGLLERKKLKAPSPQYFLRIARMSYSFLDFGLTKLNIFSHGRLTYTCPEEGPQYGLCKGCQRCSWSVSVGLARKYRIGGWLKALAVERMK